MIFLDYIYNKVYAPVEDDFGFDDAGDMDELDDELQMEEETAASGEGGDELYEHWKVQVDANQDPVRIDKYLADKMAYQSRNRIQQAADAGFIHVNGKPVKSNYKVLFSQRQKVVLTLAIGDVLSSTGSDRIAKVKRNLVCSLNSTFPSYDEVLATACKNLEKNGEIDREALLPYPSILFGMETALLHFRARSLQFWHTPFSKGKEGIPINGLIWMGNFDEMYRRIGEKMQQGFRCIKLKIGAIDFEKELELLAHIRRHFTPAQIELRVDANGAFSPADALEKLHRLSEFQLHSIEQPIRAGQWNEMARLCAATPFPIAPGIVSGTNQVTFNLQMVMVLLLCSGTRSVTYC